MVENTYKKQGVDLLNNLALLEEEIEDLLKSRTSDTLYKNAEYLRVSLEFNINNMHKYIDVLDDLIDITANEKTE